MCRIGIFRRYYLLNPELVFSNGPEGHNEVDDDFAVYAKKRQSIDLTDAYAQAHIQSGKTILIELPSEFKE